MNITNGGTVGSVYLQGSNYVGCSLGSTGTARVNGAGSKWASGYGFYLGSGTVSIADNGMVVSQHSYLGYYSGPTAVVTVDGAGSRWSNGLELLVGYQGTASLSVTNGTIVSNSMGGNDALYRTNIGSESGSSGTVTVSGAGSILTSNPDIHVGHSGSGVLNIIGGGTVSGYTGTDYYSSSYIGYNSGSAGTVTVNGAGSVLTGGYAHYIGYSGNGTLNITRGGAVTSNAPSYGMDWSYGTPSYVGYNSGSTGVVTVNGTGSIWNNWESLYVGFSGTGTLGIIGGGSITTGGSVSINDKSLLAIDVGRGSKLTVSNGTGPISQQRQGPYPRRGGRPGGGMLFAHLRRNWIGTGTYQPVGGTWSSTSHQFTASSVTTTMSGYATSIDLASIQRVLVSDSSTGWTVGESFLATTSSSTLTCSATAISDGPLTSLNSSLGTGGTVLSGWTLAATGGYTAGDPVYLSFGVGAGQSPDDLEVWQYTGGSWSEYAATDLTYDGTYASFTATAWASTPWPCPSRRRSPCCWALPWSGC